MPKKLKTQKAQSQLKKKDTPIYAASSSKKPTRWQCGVCCSQYSVSEPYCTYPSLFRHRVLPDALLPLLHGGVLVCGEGPVGSRADQLRTHQNARWSGWKLPQIIILEWTV